MMTKFNTLINRIQTLRPDNIWLNNEADILIDRLLRYKLSLSHSETVPVTQDHILHSTTPVPFSDELIAHVANDHQCINIMLDNITLDYQADILPNLRNTSLAVRFTDSQPQCYGPYTLTFLLMSPAEKACQLITRYPAAIQEETLRYKITELEERKLQKAQEILDPAEFLSVISLREKCQPASLPLSAALILRISELVPFLSKHDLTDLLSFFWGGDLSATTEWLRYLQAKNTVKNARQVIAPSRTVISSGLMSDPLTTGEYPACFDDIPLCPLADGVPLSVVPLSRQSLFEISREITLTVARSSRRDTVIIPDDPFFTFSDFYQQRDDTDLLLQQENDASQLCSHLAFLFRNTPFSEHDIHALIRTLQTRSDRHGELLDGLMIDETLLGALTYTSSQDESSVFPGTIYFPDEEPAAGKNKSGGFAAKAWQLWVNHIRKKGFSKTLRKRSGLTDNDLSMLCQILIQAGYQANLQDHLAQTLEGLENNAVAGVCCAARVLNEFVAWLGYSVVHPDERPQSKMNPGAPLFTPSSAAAGDPAFFSSDNTVSGNTIWLGDWLIALSHRAAELPEGYGLTTAQRREMNKILPKNLKEN
ncbi:putative virulence factor [Morganella morganii]|uniref:putative virulence factor n=1 Tax=Morganella morganii TaxID=582 RepID=UPI0021D32D11|nr:putative virulence factor [Morganella morganii]MCU6237579.1 putative virulence factor [Morganella morganii]